MGKAEERCRVDRIELCEESLISFEGMPVVVGDEPMTAGFFLEKISLQKIRRSLQVGAIR